MLSDRLYFGLYILTPVIGRGLGAIPFGWDRTRRKITICVKARKRMMINYALVIIWELFFIFQTVRFKKIGDIDSFNINYAFAVCTTIPISCSACLLYFSEDVKFTMNGYLRLAHYIDDVYQPHLDRNKCKRAILTDLGVLVIVLGLTLTLSAVLLALAMFPEAPMFFGNFLRSGSVFLRIALQAAQMYCASSIYIGVAFLILMVFVYGVLMFTIIISEFRLDLDKYTTMDTFREPDSIIINYRAFQILQEHCMSSLGCLLAPMQAILSNVIIFGNFMLIRHFKELRALSVFIVSMWSVLSALFWAFTLNLGGYLYLSSRKTFRSWKVHKWGSKYEAKKMSKFRKSCRPILMSWNTTFVIKRLTVLKFLRGILKGTFRTLMSLTKDN